MRYRFVEGHRDRWPVRLMCQVLGVSSGGYYGWRRRPPSPRQQRSEALVIAIEAVHAEAKARYGSRASTPSWSRAGAAAASTPWPN